MLTRQGWLVTIGAAVLIGAGRVLGVLELFVLGAAAAALVLFSMVAVSLARLRLEVDRRVTPPRVYAGSPRSSVVCTRRKVAPNTVDLRQPSAGRTAR